MLIEFRVENHRSIRDEQALSLEASEGEHQPLSVVALYGANASGKSNVLAAMQFMRDAVVYSHRFWEPDGGVPRDPFAWGASSASPSLFEVTFTIDGVRHNYGFVANDERFLEEWLYVWPHGRKQTWFERDEHEVHFGEHLKGENRLAENAMRPNALFLSAAVQVHHKQLASVFGWFRAMHISDFSEERAGMLFAEGMSTIPWLVSESERLAPFRALLRTADVGIVDVKVVTAKDEGRSRARQRWELLLQHQSAVPDAWLPLDEESRGTQQLFRLAPLVLDALTRGGVVVIDELEASFHPLLALHIVRTFNDPLKNTKNAQLVFSTHDTNLLGTTIGEPVLRREQVWLTEKDSEGGTRLYPLTDFKPRKAENLERGYLQGRYGAIPFLGGLSLLEKAGEET